MSIEKLARQRSGFTLIELLMSISILAILATLAIAVLRGAEDDARAARTATVVGNVRMVIQRRMEAYETRTMPFRFADLGVSGVSDFADKNHIRKRMLAEWFRAELPTSVIATGNHGGLQRFPTEVTQLGGVAAGLPAPPNNSAPNSPEIIDLANRMMLRPSSMVSRLRRHFRMTYNAAGYWENTSFDPQFQDAECLYAILHNSWDGDRRGTHFLRPSEIGDIDGDSFPEVLDAWGEPLNFIILVNNPSTGTNAPIDPDQPQELNEYQIQIISNRSNKL